MAPIEGMGLDEHRRRFGVGSVTVFGLVVVLAVRGVAPGSIPGAALAQPDEGSAWIYLPAALRHAAFTLSTPVPPSSTPTSRPSAAPTEVATRTPSETPVGPTPVEPTPTATRSASGSTSIVVDHCSVDLFDDIPDAYVDAAGALRMVFVDKSVGHNISEGLDCLTNPTTAEAPNHCRRTEHPAPEFNVDPAVIAWSRPGGYPRARWEYRTWPTGCGGWYDLVRCFREIVEPDVARYDVVGFQFSYLEVMPGSTIASAADGFFVDRPGERDVVDLEAFAARHPGARLLLWTTSLARGIGSEASEAFNARMREHASAGDRALFDVADILSHTPDGRPCFDNRDGVPYRDEDLPDDGKALAAICPHYTTETEGGHLGSVSAGKIRVAKAFWVLMARLAGWQPAAP